MIKVSNLVIISKYFWNFFTKKFMCAVEISYNQIRENIRKLAKSKGYSINDLCEKLKITRNGFDYTFNNKAVKLSLIFDIADVLSVDYKKLIEGPDASSNIVQEDKATYEKNNQKYTEALEEIRGLYREVSRLQEENALLREELAAMRGNDNGKKEAS
jgi:transcriptional regulator with XRE-family HTH domain